MMEFLAGISRYVLPVLAIVILTLCSLALLRRKPQSLGNVSLVNTLNGDRFSLTNRETSLGRYKDCDIILNYPGVSRHHAVIICGRDAWYIIPVSKDSSVLLNGKQIEKSTLITAGDNIKLGEVGLLFVK